MANRKFTFVTTKARDIFINFGVLNEQTFRK